MDQNPQAPDRMIDPSSPGRPVAGDRRDDQRLEAIHAYEHAIDAQRGPHHRVDIVDVPPRTLRSVFTRRIAPVQIEGPEAGTLVHDFKSPTETAFKFGFGFTAGAWSFRGIVLVAVGAFLLLGIIQLLNALS